MFKVRKTDMEKSHAGFIVEAVNVIREQDTNMETPKFLADVKHILDSRFKGDWNLFLGKTVGYALKTRKKASIVLSNGTSEILVCWRSPGFEVEDLDTVKIKTTLALKEKDELTETGTRGKPLNVLSSPSPDSEMYTLETPKVLNILDGLANDVKDMEHHVAARHIRSHITARLGTIWHVAVGSTGEFTVLPAKTCTDHIIVSNKKGMKIELFRHKSTDSSGLSSLATMSVSSILNILPTILFVFLCVAFMVQKASLCSGDPNSLSVVTKTLCYITNALPLTPLAVGLFVLTVLKQVRNTMEKRRLSSGVAKKTQ